MTGTGRFTVLSFGAALLALLGYFRFSHGDAALPAAQAEPARPSVVKPADDIVRTVPVAAPRIPIAAGPAPLTPADAARLAESITDDDAGTRAGAIDALAAAASADAVPVLRKVLGSGGDVERQLALSALHTLALREGDAGGAIRELLRQAIYDGGDEAVASGAQVALEDIERDADAPDTSR